MALPKGIVGSVATSNVAAVGEQPAILANLALGNLIANVNLAQQNAVSGQQSMNQVQMTVVGKVVEQMTGTTAAQAASFQAMLSNEEIAVLRALIKMLKKQ
jgi:hypothetical protein